MRISLLSLLYVLFLSHDSFSQITTSTFSAKVDFTTSGNGSSHLSAGDLDGDGKKDVALVNQTGGIISIFGNTSVAGIVSFGTRVDYTIGGNPTEVFLEDLDNDGKLDVVSSTGPNGQVVVYRNISSGSGIALSTQQLFAISGYYISALAVADIDNDGKKDIVAGDYSTSPSYTILKNTSSSGSITFSTGTPVTIPSTYTKPTTFKLADLDNDNYADLLVFNESASVAVLKNTTVNTPSFSSTIVVLAATTTAHKGDVADIDGDGKPDVAVSNFSSNKTSVFRNTGTTGVISFATKVDFNAVGNIQNSVLKDLDADGKPELIQTAGTSTASRISIFKNYAYPGTINTGAFGTKVDLLANNLPNGLVAEDLDADGKKDLAITNWSSASLSIFKSNVVPSGDLVADYRLEGNAGDSSGYANHATAYAGVTSTTDRNGQANSAYYFNGTSSAYVQASGTSSLNIATTYNLLVSGWFKPESGTTGQANGTPWIFLASNNDNYALSYSIADSKFSFHNWVAGTNELRAYLPNKNTLTKDVWYHVAVRVDSANRASLFINGVLDTSQTFIPQKLTTGTFTIGKNPSAGVSNNWAFLGGIDDVKVYRRYVTDNEIASLAGLRKKYYSKSSGSLSQLSTWGVNPDGTGTSPLSFDSSNVTYYMRYSNNPVISGSLKIGGTGSVLVIGEGGGFNLPIAATDTVSCDSIYLHTGMLINASGAFTSNKLNSAQGSAVQYMATGNQTMAAGTYHNLVASGGEKILTGNTVVKNQLAIHTSINNPTFNFTLGTDTGNCGTVIRLSGNIKGAFTRWFTNKTNSTPDGLFPVGSGTRYAPFNIAFTTASSAGGTATAEFIPTNPGNNGLPVFDLNGGFIFVDKAGIDGYWKVTSNISTGTVTTTVTANNFTGVNAYSDIRLMKRGIGGGGWLIPGSATTNVGNNASFTVGRSGITSIAGEYAIGGDQSVNPLPVKLVSFTATLNKEENVLLNWNTAYEANNRTFVIERSIDNHHFIPIGEVKGNGTTVNNSFYHYTDNIASLKGTRYIFYRLKQIDLNGKYAYSKTASVQVNKQDENNFTLYPNPANSTLTIQGLESPADIYDLPGNKVMTIPASGTTDISSLKNGTYFIRSGSTTRKLVKF